jgi:hypothetical protein
MTTVVWKWLVAAVNDLPCGGIDDLLMIPFIQPINPAGELHPSAAFSVQIVADDLLDERLSKTRSQRFHLKLAFESDATGQRLPLLSLVTSCDNYHRTSSGNKQRNEND